MASEKSQSAGNQTKHRWRFFRAGGFDQVRLESGADLLNLDQLNQKLWVALACPTRGLEFDNKTMDLIDTDKDGRIRPPELIAAIKWAGSMLKNADDLVKSPASLALDAINDATPEGKQLLASAKQILINLGKGDAASISVEDTTDTAKIFAQTKFNGDGIVPAESAEDNPTKAVMVEIMGCLGSEPDRSGKQGISQAKLDQFFAEAQAYSDWWKKAETDAASVRPFGDQTAAAVAAFSAVKGKIDDFFVRGRLASFDPRALAALNGQETAYAAVAAKEMAACAPEIAAFPLARVEANGSLPLTEGLNPAWVESIGKFRALVVKPLLGDKTALTADDWAAVAAKFSGYNAWMAAKAGISVEGLGLKRVREILAGKSKQAITALLEKDKALEPEANSIDSVDKLVRFTRDLFTLLNNFVAFRDFYTRKAKALFQVGTLYLDGRSCELVVSVADSAKHATLAGLAKAYLAYCDCTRLSTGEKMTIAAAFTGGDSDNLMVGRNGIFYDRKGRDWDATITKIIDNPISIRQAFWSPYKKFVRMIEEQVAKRAAAAEAASTTKLQSAAESMVTADKAKPGAEPKKMDVGVVAALGVAVGALSTAAGYFLGLFKGMPVWQFPFVIVGLLLLISMPSMLIAWLKLRQRNLGPILDANGWAVNARAKMNVPFGGALTAVATLPPGSERAFTDPYAEKKSPWPTILVLLALLGGAGYVLNRLGYVHEWTQGRIGTKVERPAKTSAASPASLEAAGTNAPAPAK